MPGSRNRPYLSVQEAFSIVWFIFVLVLTAVTWRTLQAQTESPEVVYTSYFGGSGDDRITGAAESPDGTVIIVGYTASPNLPGTSAPLNGTSDVFVSKVTVPEDTTEQGQVLWTTLIGGSGEEDAGNVVVGPDGRIYVVGITKSNDFPETQSLYSGGAQDCFLAILDNDGNVLTSTRIGGSNQDGGGTSQGDPSLVSVALDGDANIYVACESLSGDFPSGNSDGSLANWRAAVVRLSESNNVLTETLGITYAAAGGNVFADGVAVDGAGNIYLTGGVEASDLPLKDAVQGSLGGFTDAYVAVFDSNGVLETGTYWGGSGFEIRDGIAVDVDGNVHIWGSTTSQDFPVVNAFQESYGGGPRDGYAVVFGPLAKSVLGSSYIGGSAYDDVGAFVRDDQGNLIYGGRSLSDDFLPQGQSGGAALAKAAARPTATGFVFNPWRFSEAAQILELIERIEQAIADRVLNGMDKTEAQLTNILFLRRDVNGLLRLLATIWFEDIDTTPNASQPDNPNGASAINVGAVSTLLLPMTAPPPPTAMTQANLSQSATTRDPINLFTGELFFLEAPDLYLGGPMPLVFERYYASHLGQDGNIQSALGNNWLHSFDGQLTRISDARVAITTNRGRLIEFEKVSGTWELRGRQDIPFQLVESGTEFILGDPRDHLLWTFDSGGKWVKVEDGKGNRHTLTYNGDQLSQVSDGLGRTFTFTYDGGGRLLSVSDGSRTVSFQHTGDNLTGVTDANGNTTTYAYDETHAIPGLLTSKTLPRGNVPYTQTYDPQGRVITQTDAQNNKHDFLYNDSATPRETAVTDALGNTETFMHDSEGKNLSIQSKAGNTVTMSYDAAGRRSGLTDRNGNAFSYAFHSPSGLAAQIQRADGSVVSYEYQPRDVQGIMLYDLAKVTYPDGTTEQLTYDANGNVTSWTDRDGSRWSFTYNERGQVLTLINPLGGVTTYAYNPNGTLASVQDELGNTTGYEYDPFDRITSINRPDGTSRLFTYDAADHLLSFTDERGGTVTFDYDANGNLVGLTDPLGNKTSYAYSPQDRLIRITDPLGNAASRSYDALGRLTSVTDENGNTLTIQYDALDHIVAITDPAGGVWGRTYDAEGILKQTTDPLGNTHVFSADPMGRLNRRTESGSGSSQLGYDTMGRLTSVQDANGKVTTIQRDARGFPVTMTLAGGITAQYTRDGLGNLTRLVDGRGGAWTISRDASGRVTAVADPVGRTTTFSYQNRGWVSSVTFPGGMGSVDFSRDGTGNVTAKTFSDGTAFNYQFDAAGRMISADRLSLQYDANDRIIESNGIRIERDAKGRITSVTLAPGRTVQYTYDERDLPITITDWLQQTTQFTYDAMGRLTQIQRPNSVKTTLSYDANGYLSGIADGALSTIILTRNDGGQIIAAERNVPLPTRVIAGVQNLTFDAASQVERFGYDALGRRTTDDRRSYSWNLASLLESYTENGVQVNFEYDAAGQRTSRISPDDTRTYVWNYALGFPAVSVERMDGQDYRYYIHTISGDLLYSIDAQDKRTRFYHYDERGNTLFLTDAQGAVVSRYAYTPYGWLVESKGELDNAFTFHGKYGVMQEGDGGLYYMRARYYDAASRQFLSKDPAQSFHPLSMSPYQFAFGNPMRFADPLGLDVNVDLDANPGGGGYDFLNGGVQVSRSGQSPLAQGMFDAQTWTSRKQAPFKETPPATRLRIPRGRQISSLGRPDYIGALFGVTFGSFEHTFKILGRNILERGRATGNYGGLASAGRGAAFSKLTGIAAGGLWGAANELNQTRAEGQGLGTLVTRTVWAGAADVALGVASAPVAIGDALTGGNISSILKQPARVATALLGDQRALRGYERAVKKGDYGVGVRVVHEAGESWAERGFLGTLNDFGELFIWGNN